MSEKQFRGTEACVKMIDLATLYEQFDAQLRRFIHGRVANPLDVEDILQEIYLRVHRRAASLREEEKLQSWLYQIARNAIIDYYRRQRPQMELPESLVLPESETADATADLAPSIQTMLACLPPEYRQALILADFEELKQQDVADRLGISLSGAKSRVQRAREKLRQAFLDCCHFEFDRRGRVMAYQPRCAACATESC
jgi:RNA polymerase sigma-70 factor, ECF subfamily